MTRWRIYYADGSVYGSEHGAPHEAPRDGVQAVTREDPATGWGVEESREGYWVWREDYGWLGVDHMGWWDYLMHAQQPLVCLFGRTLSRERYGAILKAATDDMGPKSAWDSRERRL